MANGMKTKNMRARGKITSWNDQQGYGFVTPAAGGKQVFVHIKAFSNRNRRPEIGELVSFALSADRQGRPCAVKATYAGERLHNESKQKNGYLPVTGAALFLLIVGVAALTARIPHFIFAFYLAASLLALVMYALDKSAARKGAWRTQESTLHLLSLAGGWPGALVAQQLLRHKTRKQPFRSIFWLTVLLNCSAFIWLLTPVGASALQSLGAGVV